MNRRIKAIYLMTIFGIVAFCAFEGYWLFTQYKNYVLGCAAEMYTEIVEVADKAVERQKNAADDDVHAIYRINNVSGTGTTLYSGYVAVLKGDRNITDADDEYVKEITTAVDSGLPHEAVSDVYRFQDVDVSSANTQTFQDAIANFRVFMTEPFQTDSLAADIETRFGTKCSVTPIEVAADKLWTPGIILPESVFNPRVKVIYAYNPIESQGVEIEVAVPLAASLKDMALSFGVATAVAAMLIACLILQIKTIRRQQRIADFQKEYTLTMLHELKRPVGALKLFISFMRNPRISDNDRSAALENGAKEVDNLASYFEKLRAITYSEAYEAPQSLSTFDLADVIRECAAKTRADIRLGIPEQCFVTAERQSIANVVANLVENAVKYSPAGVPIDIKVDKTEDAVEISVADRGKGVPDADKARIFDRFYHVDGNRDLPGIGLGLTYVKQVVTAHCGTVTVTDREGGGSIFTVSLPQ